MITVPVFSDENGLPQISMYVEDEDGTFRRTQNEPLRLLRDDIKGISISQGDIVTSTYDRYERKWNTPTITFHYGRPQSFYQFLRSKVTHNRFFVFTKPQLSGHISRLTLHELQLKNSTSQRKVALLKEKYIEAVELWSEEELEKQVNKETLLKAAPVVHIFSPQRDSGVAGKSSTTSKNDVVNDASKVTYFRRNKSPDGRPQQSSQETTLLNSTSINPVERDFNKRKNLIQEFTLHHERSREEADHKAQNKHFFKRFFFSLE